MSGTAAQRAPYNAETTKEKNELGRLIRAERKKRGLTQAQLSSLLENYGVFVKSGGIAKWEYGDTVPSGYQFVALCSALEIENGTAALSASVPPADMNAEGYRLLNEFQAFLVSSGRYSVLPSRHPVRMIEMPVGELPVSAGFGDFLDSDQFEMMSFPAPVVPAGADFGVYVDGRSMEPRYHDGQIVWVKSCERLSEGEIGVFFYDGCSYIKEYHEVLPTENPEDYTDSYGAVHSRVVYRSLNADYPDVPIETGAYRLFGKVLN